jgi:tRNA U34 5-methylaminomethyl-2-thiouridine-forming methyltransferase MnmC
MTEFETFIPQSTQDGSFTFISQEFGESFHSHYGARQESFLKFAAPTQLATKAKTGFVRLLDVCYGLGYNTAAALETIWSANPSCHVEIMALELNPKVPQAALTHNLFAHWNYGYLEILNLLAFQEQIQTKNCRGHLIIGDARNSILQIRASGFTADAIFLDPFSPPQCPQLWTVEFIKEVSCCLHSNGLLATYSCAAAVRTALLNADLVIASTPPVGRRTPGTIAAHRDEALTSISGMMPLSPAETEHLLTRAAIPYRDPQLQDSSQAILKRRQQEQENSDLEPTSQWRKRWL